MDSPAPARCGRCQRLIAGGAPDGLCRVCLLTEALEPADDSPAPVQDSRARAVRRFGGFDLLEELGHGGMGVVYRARQRALERDVAVKLLLLGRFANAEAVQRFQQEAIAAARLRHPHIVAVHEVGTIEGQPFLAMELIAGRDLERVVRDGTLPPREAARMVAQLARAVAHAHAHGLLHRDLKPSNVLIDADGEPHLTDFGLVRSLDPAQPGVTVTGQVLGSPGFLAPEQASGKGMPGATLDVYGLGATLYFALTGRAPFAASGLAETLRLVETTDAVSPRALNPSLPRDLDLITLRCLAKDPSRRFATAIELAEELERFLDGRPIHTRPVPGWERAYQWARRRPAAALALSLAVLLAAGGPAAAWRINQERLRTVALSRELRRQLVAAHEGQGLAILEAGGGSESLPAFLTALELVEPGEAQDLRRRVGSLLALSPRLEHRWSVGLPVRDAWLDEDAGLVVAWTIPTNDQPAILAWQLSDGSPVTRIARPPGRARNALAITRRRDALVTPFEGGLHLRRRLEGTNVFAAELPSDRPVTAAAFNRNGTLLATGTEGGQVRIWDTLNGQPRATTWQVTNQVEALTFSPDSSRLAIRHGGIQLRVLDLLQSRLTRNLGRYHPITATAFSPNAAEMLVATRDGQADVWAIFRMTRKFDFRRDTELTAAAWAPVGRTAATAGSNGRVAVWDVGTRLDVVPVLPHGASVPLLEFGSGGQRLLSVDERNELRVWNLSPAWREVPADATGAGNPVSVTNTAGGWRATVTMEGTVEVRDLRSGRLVAPRLLHPGAQSVRLTGDADSVITTSATAARRWPLPRDPRSPEVLRSLLPRYGLSADPSAVLR